MKAGRGGGQISGNHRLDGNRAEIERCQAAGFKVSPSFLEGKPVGPLRVWPGGLAMSRTLGDADVRSPLPQTLTPFNSHPSLLQTLTPSNSHPSLLLTLTHFNFPNPSNPPPPIHLSPLTPFKPSPDSTLTPHPLQLSPLTPFNSPNSLNRSPSPSHLTSSHQRSESLRMY